MRHRSKSLLVAFLLVSLTATAGAAPFAYISNSFDDTLSIIDVATNTIAATMGVGASPYGVAVSADGKRVYVANLSESSVSVIDTATRAIVATVGVGALPYGVAITRDGARAYVTNSGDDTVSVINTATNTVSATINLGSVGSVPRGVEVSPDGARIYVAHRFGPPSVSVIDAASNAVVATLDEGWGASGVAISPDGTRLYVTEEFSNLLKVIDTATFGTPTIAFTNVAVGFEPQGVAVNGAGTRIYVANTGSDTVSVIDAASSTKLLDIPVEGLPFGLAITSDGARIYVSDWALNTVSVINAASNTVMATLPVGNGPIAFGRFVEPMGSTYRFVGWLKPIHNPGWNIRRAGSRVVVRWQLEDATGKPVSALSAISSVQVGTIACSGGSVTAVSAAKGRLRFIAREHRNRNEDDDDDDDDDDGAVEDDDEKNARSQGKDAKRRRGHYSFAWQTERSWGNQCRRFIVNFDDGSSRTADFRFR